MASLDSLLRSMESVEDADQALLDIALKQLDDENPKFAKLARLAAIPRRLNEAVVGVLGEETDASRNTHLLERLSTLSFVERLPDGDLVYHDVIRDALLSRLRYQAELKEEFEEASSRLIDLYADRLDVATKAYEDVRLVRLVLHRANHRRLKQILEAAEGELIPPLLEALYHATLRDPEAGFQAFEKFFEPYEREQLLTACRALTVGVKAFLETAAPQILEAKRVPLWFWEARLDLAFGELAKAEEGFRRVLADRHAEVGLRLKVLEKFADSLMRQSRLGEARELYEEQVDLAEQSSDLQTGAFLGLGELEIRLGELAAAEASYSNQIHIAASRDDPPGVALGRGGLGMVLFERADRKAALDEIFTAVDVARIYGGAVSGGVAGIVTSFVLYLMKIDHPRLAETLASEQAALVLDPSRAMANPAKELQRLVDAWQLERAEDLLSAIASPDKGLVDDSAKADLLAAEASLREKQGRLEEAAAAWGEVVERAESDKATLEDVATAYLARAEIQLRMGRLNGARADLDAALSGWKRVGNAPAIALIAALEADLALRGGKLEEADRLLDEAQEDIERHPRLLALHQVFRGRALRQGGRFQEACDAYARAADINKRLGALDGLHPALAELSTTAVEIGDWRLAASAASVAAQASSALIENITYIPSAEALETDALNARAMRVYYRLDADGQPPLERARELLSECVEREPENFWYRLNLAYVCFASRDWQDARSHYDAVVKLMPELEGRAPTRRAIDCLLAEADEKLAARDFDAALAAYRRAEERLRALQWMGLLASVLVRIGDAHVRADRADEGEAAYMEAETVAAGAGALEIQAIALARQGTLNASRGQSEDALERFRRSVALRQEAGALTPYWELLRDCSEMGEPFVRDERVNNVLRDLREEPEIGETMQNFKPKLSAQLPVGWHAKESVTLLAPDGMANVIASSEPLDPSITTKDYASVQGDLLHKEFPGFEEHSFDRATLLGGREAFLRRFAWSPPDGEPVTQMQLYYAEEGRGYTATATTPSQHFSSVELQLRQVLEGLIIEDR